jgi:hypothetical protein
LPGRGCANSLDPRGAVLIARGNPEISHDTLQFTVQSASGLRVLLQGTQSPSGSSGVPFGQGVACVGGNVVPIPLQWNGDDYFELGAHYALSTRLSALGSITTPGTRIYQVWYRGHHIESCSGTRGNFTNALAVDWRL